MDVDDIFRDSEGVRRHEREDSEQGGREDTALFDFLMGKAFENAPSYRNVLFMLLGKAEIMLNTFGGQPICSSSCNRPRLMTRSKALVRSMKAM